MEDEDKLSHEEVVALKELAQNVMAMGRVKRLFTLTLLWAAGIVGAAYLLWDKVFSNFHWTPK